MHGHAVILRWTTALLTLVELLDQQVMLGFCIFDTPTMLIVTSEVISATLSLPDQIFCPIVLWAARRLHEDVQLANGVIEKWPATLFRNMCLAALGIQSSGASMGGYSAMVASPQRASSRAEHRRSLLPPMMLSSQLRGSCLPLRSKGFLTAIYKSLSQILKASHISGFSTQFKSTTMWPALWRGPNAE